MDDIVKQALAKWPNVPDCYGWLGLDARGRWFMRDDAALMARSNSPTLGHPKFPQAGPPDYDDSGATAMRAAASLRR